MRDRRDASTLHTAAFMLLASVVLHLILWPLGNRLIQMGWEGAPLPMVGGVMEVALVPADPEDEEAKAEREQVEKQDDESDRLVNLDRLVEQVRPDDAKFVSEFDNRVEHETRAPNQRPVVGGPPEQPGDSPDADDAQASSPDRAKALDLSDPRGQAADGQGQRTESMDVAPAEDGTLANDPGRTGAAGRPGLRGSPDAMRRTFGAPGSIDAIEDVDEGNENLLNSRRWKFASFFNRLRNAVARHWHPEVVHRARDPEGRIHGLKTRVTRLWIRLAPDGSLRQIAVEQPSGVDYLDEEAIRAVRTAQPFNNPPPQLVDPATGFIDFGFAFIFEIHGTTQIFRYRR